MMFVFLYCIYKILSTLALFTRGGHWKTSGSGHPYLNIYFKSLQNIFEIPSHLGSLGASTSQQLINT